MALKEKKEILRYLALLEEPFGIITYGEIYNILDNDVLETPKEKENLIENPKRLSTLPRTSINFKQNNKRLFSDRFNIRI